MFHYAITLPKMVEPIGGRFTDKSHFMPPLSEEKLSKGDLPHTYIKDMRNIWDHAEKDQNGTKE
jgi:hypothetical protein